MPSYSASHSSSANTRGKERDCTYLFRSPPFRLGFQGGMRNLFEPEVFYSDKGDHIDYERGFHFSRVLKNAGLRLSTLPKKPTEQLKRHLISAVRAKEII